MIITVPAVFDSNSVSCADKQIARRLKQRLACMPARQEAQYLVKVAT